MGKINVAIIGVGNCASSLVQGIHKYREIPDDETIPGIMHPTIGGYEIGDINIVAAFDVDKNKVGKDLAEAITAKPNNTISFADVPLTGVTVDRGMTHDSLGKYVADVVTKAPGPTADVIRILKERECDVVISYLPVGSEKRHQVVRGANSQRRMWLHQLHPRIHRPRRLLANPLQRPRPSPSLATTLSPSSAPPSPTASSPAYSMTGASLSIGPTSLTSAATRTS